MSLSYFNPFRSLTAVNNAAKIVGAGKLAETAWGVLTEKKPQDYTMPPYRYGLTKTTTKRKRRGGKAKTKLATVASVKRMIMGREEKKFKAGTIGLASLVNDSCYTFNVTAQVAQGTTDGARVGDSINPINLEAYFRWYTDTEAAFYQIRILVLWSGEEFNPSGSLFSTAGLAVNQIMKPCTSNFSTGIPNPKAVTILHDALVEINSNINGYEDGHNHRVNISLGGTKYSYQADASVYGKTKNLYIVIIPNYTSSNADPPETIGAVGMNYAFNFTDS